MSAIGQRWGAMPLYRPNFTTLIFSLTRSGIPPFLHPPLAAGIIVVVVGSPRIPHSPHSYFYIYSVIHICIKNHRSKVHLDVVAGVECLSGAEIRITISHINHSEETG